jgi:hypothetical protein
LVPRYAFVVKDTCSSSSSSSVVVLLLRCFIKFRFISSRLLAKVLDQLAELGAGLIADLVLGWAHDSLKNGQELTGKTLDSGLLSLEHGDDHVEDGLVLAEVVPEREELDKTRQDLRQRDGLGVSLDHAGEAAGGVVDQTGARVVRGLGVVGVKYGLEDLQDRAVVGDDVLVGAVGAQETSAEGGVGLGLRVLVLKALGEDSHHALGVRSATTLHGFNAVGHGANGGGALETLLGRSVLEDERLEHLPELTELVAKSDSKASNDLHGGLDDEPVVLGGLVGGDLEVLEVVVIPLAGVLLLKDEAEVGSDLLERSRAGATAGSKDGRAAKLEGGSNVAVDLGDNTPGWLLACVLSKYILVERVM